METIARTKFIMPRLKRFCLERARLRAKLDRIPEYPLTLVHAGAGYGKSTALASFLAGRTEDRVWYSVAEMDADPRPFMLNLIFALRGIEPHMGDVSLPLLEEADYQALRTAAMGALVNEMLDLLGRETLVVIDDYHLAAQNPQVLSLTERLIGLLPQNVHLILATREHPSFTSLGKWRLRSEVLELGPEDLAFTTDEIIALFGTQYGYELTPDQAAFLSSRTEGWAIALEMVWQALQNGIQLHKVWSETSASLQTLFDFLASEVMAKQDRATVDFLLRTSVLDLLTGPACDQTAGTSGSLEKLRRLEANGLFVGEVGEGQYRYHHLFHDFLRRRALLEPGTWRESNQLAALYLTQTGRSDDAVSHYLEAGDFERASALLAENADDLIARGRIESVARSIARLPAEELEKNPHLFTVRGDACRLTSRYDEALAWYGRAEKHFMASGDRRGASHALKGKALVFLDTVQPAEAEALLHQALELLGSDMPMEKAALLKLIAENKTNLGQAEAAERWRQSAQHLQNKAMENELDVRLCLRTGRLAAAQSVLERRLREEEGDLARVPRSHRETPLVLSLICSFIGEAERAGELARNGVKLGERLKSPFVEAVAYMRLGHARQIRAIGGRGIEEAERHYQKALSLTDQIHVERGRAEPLMGLCLLYGFAGELDKAERASDEALRIAARAGDRWLCGMTELSLGASFANAGDSVRGADWLSRAERTLKKCGDAYGIVLSQFWQAYLHHRQGREEEFRAVCASFLAAVRTHSYEFIFTRRTMFGPRDPGAAVPMLLDAHRLGVEKKYAAWLLAVLGVSRAEDHPGYTLYIQTLGTFKVWRGREEIPAKEWQREKAKQLFQLFLVHRRELLTREQITNLLWPDLEPETAERDFKVALNALNNALQPYRPARTAPFFILRHGSAYGINPSSGYWLDVEEFESLIAKARMVDTSPAEAMELFCTALDLYNGDYLPECLYEDWSSAERERLLALYLRASSQYAGTLAQHERYEDCILICERILAKDSCWEEAYRLLMYCLFRQGRRTASMRVFERCREHLRSEMGVDPMPSTLKLHEQILSTAKPSAVSF